MRTNIAAEIAELARRHASAYEEEQKLKSALLVSATEYAELEAENAALKAKLQTVTEQAERFRILGDEYAKEGDPVKAAIMHAVAVGLEKAVR